MAFVYKDGVKIGATGRPLRDFPEPATLSSHGPARIIALAEYGRKVLAVDFDPQGALSVGLGVSAHDVPTVYDLLRGTEKDAYKVIQH